MALTLASTYYFFKMMKDPSYCISTLCDKIIHNFSHKIDSFLFNLLIGETYGEFFHFDYIPQIEHVITNKKDNCIIKDCIDDIIDEIVEEDNESVGTLETVDLSVSMADSFGSLNNDKHLDFLEKEALMLTSLVNNENFYKDSDDTSSRGSWVDLVYEDIE